MNTLARWLRRQETAVLALTCTALVGVPLTLRVAAPDAAMSLLLPIVGIGAAGGFLVAGLRRRGMRSVALLAVVGLALLFIRVGELAQALAVSLWQTLGLIAVMILPSPHLPVQFALEAAWWNSLGPLWGEAVSVAARAGLWLASLARGHPGGDMVGRAFCLGAAVWLLSIWAGWRVRANNDALGGLLPASAWIAISLNANLQERWPLWLHLSAFLLLLGILNLWGLTSRWRQERTDYSDSVPEDTLLNAVVLIILLLVVGYSTSVFSMKDFIDRFREHPRAASVAGSGTPASGSVRAPVLSGQPDALQNTHLITAGPKLSKDVVMVISTGELPPMQHAEGVQAPRYHWRGATYQNYLGRAWTNPSSMIVPAEASTTLISDTMAGYHSIHGTVSLAGKAGGAVYWAGMLAASDAPLEIVWRAEPKFPTQAAATPVAVSADADMIGAQFAGSGAEPVKEYRFDSLVSKATEQQLRAAPAGYPAWVTERYLQLPPSVPERVRALARDLTVHGATPYDRALAIEAYLRKIPYSLEVPAPPNDREAADYFLFDLKKGYCDYYATSMVVLARAAGIPARLVTGYTSGGYDPYTAEYIVRDADAHSWAEVYFTGYGWIEFEPTAAQPVPSRESVRNTQSTPKEGQTKAPQWLSLPKLDLPAMRLVWWGLPAALGLLLAVTLVDTLRLRAMDPDRATRQIYHRLRRSMRRVIGAAAAGQTAREYSQLLRLRLDSAVERRGVWRALAVRVAAGTEELTRLYAESLFAPTPLNPSDSRRAIRLWSQMRWRLGILNLFFAITRQPSSPPPAPSSRLDSQAE
jgi:transglutaminase-like putative cysteine protease